jgi:hypothetical protein
MRSSTIRAVAAGLCGAVGVALILTGGLLAMGQRAVFDSAFFADRVAASLGDDAVADYVAGRVTDAVIEGKVDLVLVRPVILTTTRAIVTYEPFRAVVRTGVRESHQLLATSGGRDVLLSVSDFGVLLKSALAAQPGLAELIPENAVAVVVTFEHSPLLDLSSAILRLGRRLVVDPRIRKG